MVLKTKKVRNVSYSYIIFSQNSAGLFHLKNAQTIKDSFEHSPKGSKSESKITECVDGKEFVNKKFADS